MVLLQHVLEGRRFEVFPAFESRKNNQFRVNLNGKIEKKNVCKRDLKLVRKSLHTGLLIQIDTFEVKRVTPIPSFISKLTQIISF